MADNKKSFLLYCDYIDMFKKLPDDIAGKLIKHIFEYTNDLDPKTDDLLLEIAFEPIKKQLKRDLRKYEGVVEEKSTGGKIGNLKRWHKDIYDEFKGGNLSLDDALLKVKSRIVSDTDNEASHPIAPIAVIDTVTDTDKDIKKNIRAKRFLPPTQEEIKAYCTERKNKVDPNKFFDFYESKGWMVGKNKMKSWKASVRTWEKNSQGSFAQNSDSNHSKNRTEQLKENTIKAAKMLGLTDE